MAKAKEKMEALVPVEEQPYTVPANWRWCYIRAGYNVTSSKRIHKDDWKTEGIPFYRTRELVKLSEYGYVDNELFISPQLYEKCKREYGVPRINDLLISGVGTIGIPYVVKDETPFYFKDGNVIWLQNKGLFYSQYIFYLYKSHYMQNQVYGMSSGTTVDTYTIINANSTVIPAPPIAEQQRIVDRIESLFSKLDEAKEKAQAVVDGYEDRKAAILHKAFTGELTEKWRKENDGCFRKTVTIKSICFSLAYGTASKSLKEGNVAVIRMGNLQGGEIDWGNLVYSNNEAENQKYRLYEGDILFNRTNSAEQVGKTSIYRGEMPAIYAGYLIKLDYDHSKINGEYLNYLLNSPEAKEYCNRVKTDAVNQSNINAQKIGAFEIPLISIDEQKELVGKVAFLIDSEKMTRDSAEKTIKSIETMKKSILAKAFRGELGTNDPSEEPVAL